MNALTRYAHIGDLEDFDATAFLMDMKAPAFNLFSMYVLQSGFTFLYILLLSQIGEQMAAKLRQDLFKQIIIQDLSFFDANRTGELVNRLTADVQDFKSCFKQCVSQGLRSIAQLIGKYPFNFFVSFKIFSYFLIAITLETLTFHFRWWNFIVFNITKIGNRRTGFGAICCCFHVAIGQRVAIVEQKVTSTSGKSDCRV